MVSRRAHSPPFKGGVAAPLIKRARSLAAQTGWLVKSNCYFSPTTGQRPSLCRILSPVNGQEKRTTQDVRMRGFGRRHSVEAALAWLDAQLQPLGPESLRLQSAAGRALVNSITSEVDVPGFDRATMDGYALAAESTEGAS